MENNRPLGWTTLEESKRLVDAGLDPNTADMCYIAKDYIDGKELSWYCKETVFEKYGEKAFYVEVLNRDQTDFYPCWSLGAMIDMMPMFEYDRIKIPFGAHVVSTGEIVLQYFTSDTGESIVAKKGKEFIDAVISMILWLLKNNHIKKHE